MQRARVHVLMLCPIALAACGRTVTIGALDPAPRLRSPGASAALELIIEPTTPDVVQVARASGFPAVEVRSFRETLRRGFLRGFGAGAAPAPRRLHVVVSTIEFVSGDDRDLDRGPGARFGHARVVLVHGAPHVKRSHRPGRRLYATVEFAAYLQDGGVERGRLTGHAVARISTDSSAEQIGRSIASAVSRMYERIGRELIRTDTAGLSAAAGLPVGR